MAEAVRERTELALRFLRSRTIKRSVRSYLEWVGRAVGWWTLAYLAFWGVVYFIAGIETLSRLDQPLPVAVVRWAALAGAALFLALGLSGRAPPVSLDRRDLYRLALGPTTEASDLRLRLNTRRALLAAGGAAAGGVWSLIAPYYFHLVAPWAAPALALLALAYGEAAWSRYARREGPAGEPAGAATAGAWDAVALVVAGSVTCALSAATAPALSRFGALRALSSNDVTALLVPLALAAGGLLVTQRTLTVGWPRRFLAQSLVLTQLQAMRTFQLIAGMAGVPRARGGDAGERQRLLAALHDRPGAVRPSRSLRPPPADASQRRAFAWRTASALLRRPRFAQARLVVGALTAAAAVLMASAQVARLTTQAAAPVADAAGGVGNGFAVGLTVLLSAAWLAVVAGAALGPAMPRSSLPVNALARTQGRLLPFAALLVGASIVVLGLAAAAGPLLGAPGVLAVLVPAGVPVAQLVLAAIATCSCCCLALEKYSSWTQSAPGSWECVLIASLLTAMPAMLAAAFGVPGWALTGQLLLAAIVYLVNV